MPYLNLENNSIHYQQYGHGEKLMFCFHGFADNASLFEDISKVFAKEYTLISIDLPFHGKTVWKSAEYTPMDIKNIIQFFLSERPNNKIDLCCHSMGGRIILGILKSLETEIENIYFIASAGFGYTFSASRLFFPMVLRKFTSKYLQHYFLTFFTLFNSLKLLNDQEYLVFKNELESDTKRMRLIDTWRSMYFFPMRFSKEHINIINNNNISCIFIFGKRDKITPYRKALKIIRRIQNHELLLLKGNHFFVRNKLKSQLSDWYKINRINK